MNKPQECIWCNGTGEINGMGFLDCTHCTAAAERFALNQFVLEKTHLLTQNELDWAIHQRAVAMCGAKVQASPEPADVLKRRMDDK